MFTKGRFYLTRLTRDHGIELTSPILVNFTPTLHIYSRGPEIIKPFVRDWFRRCTERV